MLKRIVNTLVWTVVGLFLTAVVLFHVPFVQEGMGRQVAHALSAKLGTEVAVGRIDLGFANRLIIDDVRISDQQQKPMLQAARLSAKIDVLALFQGRIVVTSSQFFGLRLNLYKANAASPLNCQFVIDSLSSKKPKTEPSAIDLQIGAIVIRHGQVAYRRLDRPTAQGKFSTDDIALRNLSGHLVLNRLTRDSLNLHVKKLSFDEKSGFSLKRLSFHFVGNRHECRLTGLQLALPSSKLQFNDLTATYEFQEGRLATESLAFKGGIDISEITPSDLAAFVPQLRKVSDRVAVYTEFQGGSGDIHVPELDICTIDPGFGFFCSAHIDNAFDPQKRTWRLQLQRFDLKNAFARHMAEAMGQSLPAIADRLGDIVVRGEASGSKNQLQAFAELQTAAGEADLHFKKKGEQFSGSVDTKGLDLGRLTDSSQLGTIAATATIEGASLEQFRTKAEIALLQFRGYDYRDAHLEGQRQGNAFDGKLDLRDANADVVLSAHLDNLKSMQGIRLDAAIHDVAPAALHLSRKWSDARFGFDLTASLSSTDIHDATGTIDITDFSKTHAEAPTYTIDRLSVSSERQSGGRMLTLDSDFGRARLSGNFDYATLPNSIISLVSKVLPNLPGLPKTKATTTNEFTLQAAFSDTEWMNQLLGIPLSATDSITLTALLDDRRGDMSLSLDAPRFSYAGKPYLNTSLNLTTPDQAINAVAHTEKLMDSGRPFSWDAQLSAHHDRLTASIQFDNHAQRRFRGQLNADTWLQRADDGLPTAYVDVQESELTVGEATWYVRPSTIIYKKDHLTVDGFSIENENQFLAIDGSASKQMGDSLVVELQNIDVSYVLNLVDFHAVEFSGDASGHAYVAGAFSSEPHAEADLRVANFRFENGRMGTLHALAAYDNAEGQINIDAVAQDEGDKQTTIRGYVSPKNSYIDLAIGAHDTRLEFMESFCSSFLQDIEASASGDLRLYGPLSNINLTGQLVAGGKVGVTSLATAYTFENDTVRFVPDEIKFSRDTLYDRNGNIGILSGSLYHQHLTNLSYDLNIAARNLLSYDTHTYGENTFFGTVYATGNCRIQGRSGEVDFDIDATPNKGTMITYKVDSPTAITSSDFLTWVNRQATDSLAAAEGASATGQQKPEKPQPAPYSTDIRMNFLVNCTPDATIKLIMDERSGDYIALNGDGVMRATYYNKGSFDIYGNYVVDHGTYKLTIQDVIRKDFTFEQGGVLAFGGDPFDANISLKAHYVLNGVSLSDLNIGRSFNNNNVRVDCLMNITGTANSPKVDFSLDMPTLGNDVKQMVRSIINAEEEMNQQVLYLLAVGRFYNRSNNNAGSTTQDSQASLAMQSFLSGTVSQQINQVLGAVVNSNNWNFGANISTGSEGFYNAEYEGILSGRLFNNRLIFNGQFGYRDNANATTSFIGDFDLRYLLFPNGNLSINVYNKANDRYFTRNSLNTQGIGITLKKDFNGLRDLFGIKRRSQTEAEEK